MKQIETNFYETPEVEVIEVEVEQGFAQSVVDPQGNGEQPEPWG